MLLMVFVQNIPIWANTNKISCDKSVSAEQIACVDLESHTIEIIVPAVSHDYG